MKKALSILILAIVALVLFSQVDDDLSDQATDLIGRLEPDAASESYLYLSGIFAGEDESPALVGKSLLEEYRKLEANESYEVAQYPDAKKLVLPTGEAFCRSWEEGCLEYLFSAEVDAEKLLKDHGILVSRSNRFLEFSEYKTLTKPTVTELYPPYQYIAAAERLKVLGAISAYKNGGTVTAIESLSDQFEKLRKSLALQDNLIGKLVFLMKLSEVVDVLSIVLTNEDLGAEEIPGLSGSEKSFYMIAAREFGMSYHTLKSLDRHPEFFEVAGNVPGWLTRMVYKPNMTINAVAPKYYRLDRLAQLSPVDFAKEAEPEDRLQLSTSKLRNAAGGVLIAISPGLDKYVAHFHDFDAKLALFNQVHHLKLAPDSMQNPYYGHETPKESDGKLCFSGPLEDKRSLRCLRVKI